MTERMYLFVVTVLWCIGVAFVVWSIPAHSQEHTGHPPEHMALHEMFYSKWNMPDNRGISCCSRQDCAPVDRVEYKADGTIWMLRASDQVWLKIPTNKIEHNYNDAKGSPDGRSHMCSAGATVYCAVLGDGT